MVKVMDLDKKFIFVILILFYISSICISNENKEYLDNEESKKDCGWFREYGDYLVYLTLQNASPKEYLLSISSNMSFFETGIGKRLRIGSPVKDIHWGIEFGLFTSLKKIDVWSFKNISSDGKYGIFSLFDLKQAILLIRLAHYCSNLLQGGLNLTQPIKYSQYFIYSQLFFPMSNLKPVPCIKLIKPYFGVGAYFVQFPESHHLPFDFGIEIESIDFLLPYKALLLEFHCIFNGMQSLVPTFNLLLGWGSSSDIKINSLPFLIAAFYQWGQDARGQFFQQRRELFGIRFNLIY
jgi:hypothetical protein